MYWNIFTKLGFMPLLSKVLHALFLEKIQTNWPLKSQFIPFEKAEPEAWIYKILALFF